MCTRRRRQREQVYRNRAQTAIDGHICIAESRRFMRTIEAHFHMKGFLEAKVWPLLRRAYAIAILHRAKCLRRPRSLGRIRAARAPAAPGRPPPKPLLRGRGKHHVAAPAGAAGDAGAKNCRGPLGFSLPALDWPAGLRSADDRPGTRLAQQGRDPSMDRCFGD
jgi:hypothetical protein